MRTHVRVRILVLVYERMVAQHFFMEHYSPPFLTQGEKHPVADTVFANGYISFSSFNTMNTWMSNYDAIGCELIVARLDNTEAKF